MLISTVSTGELLLRNVYWDWVKGSLFGIHKVWFAKVELTKDLKGRKQDLNIRPESTRIRFIQWPVLIGFTVYSCHHLQLSYYITE
jgi:hypothetical protein